MEHFARTHSLTLVGNQASAMRMILLVRKQSEGTLPCYWLRLDDATVGEAIEIGHAAVSETVNIAVVTARSETGDGLIADSVAHALTAAGLAEVDVREYPRSIARGGPQ